MSNNKYIYIDDNRDLPFTVDSNDEEMLELLKQFTQEKDWGIKDMLRNKIYDLSKSRG